MPQEAIATIAGIAGGLTAIFALLYTIYKIARRLDDAVGVDKQGRTISERLDRVEHQLWKNGGDSLADHVSSVMDQSKETATEVRLMKEILLKLVGQTPGGREAIQGAPTFGLQQAKKKDD